MPDRISLRIFLDRMVIQGSGLALGFALGFLAAAVSAAPESNAPAAALTTSRSDSATIRHAFDDVPHWVNVFDDTARAAWQKPDLLVNALRVAPGQTVADIGAGTGYFNRFFARAVGDSGRVLAVDLEPGLIAHMAARARAEGTQQVEPILAAPDDPHLPSGLDLVFLCNTYHHIDGRRAYFDRLRALLRAGGRLVIVDFKPGELPVGPPPEHKLAPEVVTLELGAAGYAVADTLDILPYQFVLIFRPAKASRDR
jgi:SAM-dependent methyltransferase